MNSNQEITPVEILNFPHVEEKMSIVNYSPICEKWYDQAESRNTSMRFYWNFGETWDSAHFLFWWEKRRGPAPFNHV